MNQTPQRLIDPLKLDCRRSVRAAFLLYKLNFTTSSLHQISQRTCRRMRAFIINDLVLMQASQLSARKEHGSITTASAHRDN